MICGSILLIIVSVCLPRWSFLTGKVLTAEVSRDGFVWACRGVLWGRSAEREAPNLPERRRILGFNYLTNQRFNYLTKIQMSICHGRPLPLWFTLCSELLTRFLVCMPIWHKKPTFYKMIEFLDRCTKADRNDNLCINYSGLWLL